MDRLCKIRDLQRAVMRFEADFEAHYGISLNEGMTLCTLSGSERMCPGELGEALGLTPSNRSNRKGWPCVKCVAGTGGRSSIR